MANLALNIGLECTKFYFIIILALMLLLAQKCECHYFNVNSNTGIPPDPRIKNVQDINIKNFNNNNNNNNAHFLQRFNFTDINAFHMLESQKTVFTQPQLGYEQLRNSSEESICLVDYDESLVQSRLAYTSYADFADLNFTVICNKTLQIDNVSSIVTPDIKKYIKQM